MEYIPDKALYSAVRFALKMCPTLQCSWDSKISVAANYYNVNRDDVFRIVKDELWKRARYCAKEDGDNWYTVYNPQAPNLLGTGLRQDFVFICPHCGANYACNVHDDYSVNKLYVSQCRCGFIDKDQRKHIRKDFFNRITHKED